jgi:hypothetical protein
MASKIALAIENILKRKTYPISLNWHKNEERVSQKHLDQSDVDHNAITTEEMEYPGMMKASGEVTVLDKNMPTNSIETNRTSNRTRKI